MLSGRGNTGISGSPLSEEMHGRTYDEDTVLGGRAEEDHSETVQELEHEQLLPEEETDVSTVPTNGSCTFG